MPIRDTTPEERAAHQRQLEARAAAELAQAEFTFGSVFAGEDVASNIRFTYHAYDFLTGRFLGEVPARTVQMGKILNGSGTLTASIDMRDKRVNATAANQITIPNKSVIVADYEGSPFWVGVSQPRKWDVDASGSGTTGILGLSYVEIWSYFAQRAQATDYSSPPYSGISGGTLESPIPMPLWTRTPEFAPLIGCQIMLDALSYSDSKTMELGNPLGGMSVTLNGKVPNAAEWEDVPPANLIALNYPFPSLQTIDSIISQQSQLGVGVGYDHGMSFSYQDGLPMGKLEANWDIQYPWRGYDTQAGWAIDVSTARKYSFPEDGSQTGNQLYEVGGGGAIYVDVNVAPLEQGYPLLERIISRSSIQSPGIMSILALLAESDLTLYSYPPVTPSITLGINHANPIFSSYSTGSLVRIIVPKLDANGEIFDPMFPDGMDLVWRITGFTIDMKDEGDPTVTMTFAKPVLGLAETNSPFPT